MDIDIVELDFNEVELTRNFRVTAVYSIHQNLNIVHDVMDKILGHSQTVNLRLLEFYDPMMGFARQLEEMLESSSGSEDDDKDVDIGGELDIDQVAFGNDKEEIIGQATPDR